MYAELRHLDGASAGQTRIVNKEFATIGRLPSADVQFDPERDLDVSGRHAALFRHGSGWVLRDLGSTNGTWVNGTRIQGDCALAPNDVIRFGPRGPQLVFATHHGEPAAIPETRQEAIGRPGPTTQRIRVEVRKQTAPWRRATVALGILAVAFGISVALLMRQRSRELEAERTDLLARTDSLMARLQASSSSLAALEGALQDARRETRRMRGSLASGGVSAERLDSFSRVLASSLQQHEAVLQAAHLDAAGIARQYGDAIALVVSEFPSGRRVAGTGFAVRVRGDTGWIVTSKHLVADPSGGRAARLGVIFNGSNQNFRAELVTVADSADLALLAVQVRGGVPVIRGLGGAGRVGEAVAILGFPFGFDFPMGSDWRKLGVSVTSFAGTVRKIRDDAVEIDAYGASGSSGSPLFNAAGEVIGVVYGGDPGTAGRMVYAVPVRALENLLRAVP